VRERCESHKDADAAVELCAMAADPPASAPAPRPAPEQAPAPAPPPRRGPGLLRLVALLALVAALVVAGWLLFIKDDEDSGSGQERQTPAALSAELRDGEILAGPDATPFAMRYTKDWEPMEASELEDGDPRPTAGIRRKDRTGVLTVTVRGPVRGGINRLRTTLPGELERRFDDFRLVAIRTVEVAAGRALYASWIREETGRVQSNLVVPEGNRRSYSVDAVIQGDAQETAQEVGAMFRTFSIVGR